MSSRRGRVALIGSCAMALAVAGAGTTAGAASSSTAASGSAYGLVRGLPAGVADAAKRVEPTLPTPAGWPFAEAWSRTSGTGRLAGGASYWTDFLYDDHGAQTQPVDSANLGTNIAALAPVQGGYSYPAGPADGNGADVFRNAVGVDAQASYWRVDWNTLVDRTVPIAEWTIDTDRNAATGVSAWPAGAGVTSPGIEKAIVVSGRSARVIDLATGRSTDVTGGLTVDMNARSFVVRIPRKVLPVSGTGKVRLAAGLADAAGTGFAPATGALPGQPAVYNVTYRTVAQEPARYDDGASAGSLMLGDGSPARAIDLGNFWNEDHQALALARNDVSEFSLDVDFTRLARKPSTPEPLVTGFSDRWYVTDLNLGQGVVANPPTSASGDYRPNYLGRVQPYGVYVPTTYRPSRAAPLTWVLHSLSVNHNQYGALDPRTLQQLCEARGSICATTLGFGPDGWYHDEAEHDFWQVWRQLALAYRLDPERTVISGYSMGGYATYKLGLEYPDLFAAALSLAGPPACIPRLSADLSYQGVADGHCGTDGDTTPLVRNARWIPYSIAQGGADELVPVSSVVDQVNHFDALGYRYRFELRPAEDHLVYATQDDFTTAVAGLGGTPKRVTDPGRVDYTWYPNLVRSDLGLGVQSVYWLSGLSARTGTPGSLASLTAIDGARPDPAVTTAKSVSPVLTPTPGTATTQRWTLGATPAASRTLTLTLTDVAGLTVDTARAGLPHGTGTVTTDGPTTLRLAGLAPGTVVRAGNTSVTAGGDGVAAVPLAAGTSTLRW